ncbi:MAG: VTT domain-containing protein [Candidatus Marinimicrobia bacterium]|nr:VTT domain-containing protein [Candidatus Neomarinimicrobiota bacterium]
MIRKYIGIIILMLCAFSLILGGVYYRTLETDLAASIENYGIFGLFISSVLLDFIPQYVSPHLGLVSGVLLGLNAFFVTLVTIGGSVLGSFIGYETGRFSTTFTKRLIGERYSRFRELINKKGKWAVMIAAVSPIPYVPLIIGTVHMSRANFIVYGLIPRTIGFILLATGVSFIPGLFK